MSYKYTILSDNPILYYRSNELLVNSISTYQDVLDEYGTYTAFLAAFPNYQAAGTNLIQDSSPCNNDGGYSGVLDSSRLPLIPGESFAMKIDIDNNIVVFADLDYNQSTAAGGFGTASTSDNDFTLEFWFYPSFTTTNKTPLMGDLTENVGLFYDKGNVTFAVDSEEITYTLPYLKKAYHVVATYSQDSISLYLDKNLVISKALTNFVFTNSTLSLQSGPTLSSNDYFLINAIAAYRYALPQSRIEFHYNMAQTLIPIQVATPDAGELFEFYDNAITTQFSYSYPANKGWNNFLTEDLYYDTEDDYIQIAKGSGVSKTVILQDFITIPSGPTMDSSRIEWDGDNGIIVESSVDGITYQSCINGQAIPQYKLGSFHASRSLHLKITMSTTDDSKYLPILDTLSMSFYNDQRMYAQNYTSYFTTLEGVSGVTEFEVSLSNNLYGILSRDARNGLRVVQDSGFYINTDRLINTIEFFYTPSTLTDSGLISSLGDIHYSASNYSWRNSGTISKSNISAIYVNGVNKTSQTNVSNVFAQGELHHVVMVFTSPISSNIKFNHSLYGAVPALYQNVIMYQTAFDSTAADLHYDLYMGTSPTILNDSSFTVTENSVTPYDNDWLVYQTV
jgi:hypothetical protein